MMSDLETYRICKTEQLLSLSVNQEIKTGTLPHGISKFPFLQNWKFNKMEPYHMASLDLLFLQKQEISKTGNALPHGISGVAVLLDQHIAKTV